MRACNVPEIRKVQDLGPRAKSNWEVGPASLSAKKPFVVYEPSQLQKSRPESGSPSIFPLQVTHTRTCSTGQPGLTLPDLKGIAKLARRASTLKHDGQARFQADLSGLTLNPQSPTPPESSKLKPLKLQSFSRAKPVNPQARENTEHTQVLTYPQTVNASAQPLTLSPRGPPCKVKINKLEHRNRTPRTPFLLFEALH